MDRAIRVLYLVSLAALSSLGACDVDESSSSDVRIATERWSAKDDPGKSPIELSTNLSALPSEGTVARPPWPGYAWHTIYDSLNYAWAGAGTESPAAKYARLFGIENLDDVISKLYGVAQSDTVARCSATIGCRSEEECSFHQGESDGYCIPIWWGLCHAWSVAAVLEPEPVQPVVLNGVTFEPNDIKGLLVLTYDRPEVVFVSQRCNGNNDFGGIRYDDFDRPESKCRDINPGAFHVFLANYVGLLNQSFVTDVVFDEPVGSLSVYSYKVQQSRELSLDEARSMVGDVLSPDTRSTVHMNVSVSYVESTDAQVTGNLTARLSEFIKTFDYSYVLELDRHGSIIGGEWEGESKTRHPDFIRLPQGPGSKPVAGGFVHYSKVKQLVDASAQGAQINLKTIHQQASVGPNEWKTFGPFNVANGGHLEASVSSQKNVELFLYKGNAVSTQEYACRRRFAQTSTPCFVAGPGPVWIKVLGRSFNAQFELSVLYGQQR
ncbi:MAG: hypothetical protein MUC50_13470 [Myxococcota bacterium]|nr:hypothetical protein [Myxococcota bacterium]